MLAAINSELGGDPVIREFPAPPAQPGTSIVRVLAAGLQPTDIMRSKGVYNPPSPPMLSEVKESAYLRTVGAFISGTRSRAMARPASGLQ